MYDYLSCAGAGLRCLDEPMNVRVNGDYVLVRILSM